MKIKTTYVDDALKKIRKECDPEMSSIKGPKFCFIVGAGISYPEIPLASKIKEECIEMIKEDDPNNEKLSKEYKDSMTEYFELIYEAFQCTELRWNYFTKKVRDDFLETILLILHIYFEKKEHSLQHIHQLVYQSHSLLRQNS